MGSYDDSKVAHAVTESDVAKVHKNLDHKWRLGVVSYLNARPLIEGLEADDDFELIFDVPARLPSLLDQGLVDAALVPVIDLACRDRSWGIVSDACIGCDGETLTVRVYSRVPAESVRVLHADSESHTSVALARIVWQELYHARIDVVPFPDGARADECEAILLIGDKVVAGPAAARLKGYKTQLDLGAAWKSLTSLPFVFAVWAAPCGRDIARLAERLCRARNAGVESAERIAETYGPISGWPVPLAKRYLTKRLRFTLGDRQRLGIMRFLELARSNDLVDSGGELVFA